MPELPEIEIVKRSLSKKVNNSKIIAVKIKNRNLRYKLPSSFSRNLIGQKIIKVSRRSKYLIVHFRKKTLLIHFGMSGKILILSKNDKKLFKTSFYYDLNILKKHNHIYIFLDNDLILIYNDIRRFGFFKLYNTTFLKKVTFLKKLGLEPFSKRLNINYFKKYTKKRAINIKSLFMNQNFISGLGNIYVNEILFLSKINPLRSCNNLDRNEIKKLILNTKKIIKLAISKGGSSIRDFKDAFGEKGNFQQFFYVYGKNGKRCSRISCAGIIRKVVISNRSSFYCNKCQT